MKIYDDMDMNMNIIDTKCKMTLHLNAIRLVIIVSGHNKLYQRREHK